MGILCRFEGFNKLYQMNGSGVSNAIFVPSEGRAPGLAYSLGLSLVGLGWVGFGLVSRTEV